jgi:hypothetical protein
VRIRLIVPAIRSREVAQLEGSPIRQREDALQEFDFGDRLFGVHSSSISTSTGGGRQTGLEIAPGERRRASDPF